MSEEMYVVQYLADGQEWFTEEREPYAQAKDRAHVLQENGYEVVAVVTTEYVDEHRNGSWLENVTRIKAGRQITPEDLVGPEAAAEMRRSVAQLKDVIGSLPVEAGYADRSHDAGEALSGVRTVLSRAETALDALGPTGTKLEWPSRDEYPDFVDRRQNRFEDPDAEDMRVALEEVIQILGRWRKMGRTVRSTCR